MCEHFVNMLVFLVEFLVNRNIFYMKHGVVMYIYAGLHLGFEVWANKYRRLFAVKTSTNGLTISVVTCNKALPLQKPHPV